MACAACGKFRKGTYGDFIAGHICSCKSPPIDRDSITPEERSMLNYFFVDKGDVSKWAGWEDFADRHPAIKVAHLQYRETVETAEKNFKDLLDSLL